eukprot:624844-Amphidinium_carterae.1
MEKIHNVNYYVMYLLLLVLYSKVRPRETQAYMGGCNPESSNWLEYRPYCSALLEALVLAPAHEVCEDF